MARLQQNKDLYDLGVHDLALGELARREMCRRSYKFFLREFFPETPLAAHHELIVDKLQALVDGEFDRLMVFLPPGSAKSTYANMRFMPWALARKPGQMGVTVSHTMTLVERWGGKSRNLAQEKRFESVFNTSVKKNAKSVSYWVLDNHSEYAAFGVGTAITGNRADIVVIDDPVSSREAADSLTQRTKIWNWYIDELHTRLKPGNKIVLIMTRWHEDDLAGRLLEQMKFGAEPWEVVSIPAECESQDDLLGREIGEMLWPEYFTPKMWAEAKRNPRTWASLYQQRPAPEEGSYFEKLWFQYYDTLPGNLRFYGASDYAVSEDKGDYTVHVVAGYSNDGNLYIADVWREQATSAVWMEAWTHMLRTYNPTEWAEENGAILKALDPFIRKTLTEQRLYSVRRRQFTPTADKKSRARTLQGMMQSGKIFLPRPGMTPWVTDLVNEMLMFPAGKHDDQVDALATLCLLLDQMRPIPKGMRPEKFTNKRLTLN